MDADGGAARPPRIWLERSDRRRTFPGTIGADLAQWRGQTSRRVQSVCRKKDGAPEAERPQNAFLLGRAFGRDEVELAGGFRQQDAVGRLVAGRHVLVGAARLIRVRARAET